MGLHGFNTRSVRTRAALAGLLVALLLASGLKAGDYDPDVDLWPFLYVGKDPDKQERIVQVLYPFVDSRSSPKRDDFYLHPLYNSRLIRERDLKYFEYVWPFGLGRRQPALTRWSFFPLYLRDVSRNYDGVVTQTRFFLLPFILYKSSPGQPLSFALWPLWGNLYHWYWRRHVTFVLWPFYVRQEGKRAVTHSVPWPFIEVIRWKEGSTGFKFWPFYARNRSPDGKLDKGFVLWPFYSWLEATNRDGMQTDRWMFWPFYGQIRDTNGGENAVLWPFFIHRWDRSEYREEERWEYPWPFLGHRKGIGKLPVAGRRFWPIYTWQRQGDRFYADALWPILWYFSESPKDPQKYGKGYCMVLPFYQNSWERSRGKATSWVQVWPFYQRKKRFDGSVDVQVLSPWPDQQMMGGWTRNWQPFFRVYHGEWPAEGGFRTWILGRIFRLDRTPAESYFELRPFIKTYSRERTRMKPPASRWSILMGLIGREEEGGRAWVRFLWFFRARL